MAKKGISGVLYQVLNDAVKAMSSAITNKSGAGPLSKSLTAAVEVKQLFEYDATISTSAEYYDFYNLGVKGSLLYKGTNRKFKNNAKSPFSYKDKKPPVNSLIKWSKKKGYSPYAVRYSIWRDGLNAHNITGIGIAEIEKPQNMQLLSDAIAETMSNNIDLIIESEEL